MRDPRNGHGSCGEATASSARSSASPAAASRRRPRRARPRLHPRDAAAAVAAVEHLVPRRGPRPRQRARGGPGAARRQPLGRQPDAGHDRLHARLLDLLRRRARLPPARPQPRALAPRAVVPAQVRDGRGLAGERPPRAGVRRRGARLPGRRLRGPPPLVGAQPRRLRRPQGLHPARDRAGRAARAGRRRRRAGDGAVPLARRAPRCARSASTGCSA